MFQPFCFNIKCWPMLMKKNSFFGSCHIETHILWWCVVTWFGWLSESEKFHLLLWDWNDDSLANDINKFTYIIVSSLSILNNDNNHDNVTILMWKNDDDNNETLGWVDFMFKLSQSDSKNINAIYFGAWQRKRFHYTLKILIMIIIIIIMITITGVNGETSNYCFLFMLRVFGYLKFWIRQYRLYTFARWLNTHKVIHICITNS